MSNFLDQNNLKSKRQGKNELIYISEMSMSEQLQR